MTEGKEIENNSKKPSEQALLTEYQVCQQYISERATSYWTLTGIFIGFSSVLLGALIYGFLSSPNKESILFGVATCVISTAVLVIFYFLKFWLKRVSFLQQINFHRMRDIERDLGMWQSWRVHGVDHWRGSQFDSEITEEDSTRLFSYQPPGFWQYWRDKQRYEGSSNFLYKAIFYTLFGMWALVFVCGLILLCYCSCCALKIALGVAILIWLSIFLCKKFCK